MSNTENSHEPVPVNCADAAPLLVFYACDEVTDAERVAMDAHIADCSACSEQLAQERKLLDAVGLQVQPADLLDTAGVLLAQCRSELAEKIDELAAPARKERWHPFGWARRWMALRPAWSAAALVVFGVALGTQLLPWLQTANDVAGPAVNVLAAPKLSDEQLSKMAVAGIRVSPAPDAASENIQVDLSAEQPMVLSGNIDDNDMRRVLTFIVGNSERFDAGVRLECLDALKSRTDDAQVRQALLGAAREDQNAAVRMKALDSLRDVADDEEVRQAVLDILTHDASPGVRVAAVNLLVRAVEEISPDAPASADDSELSRDHTPEANRDPPSFPLAARCGC